MGDFDPAKFGKPVAADFDPTQFGKPVDTDSVPDKPSYVQSLIPQGAQIKAGKPSGVKGWLDSAENDIRYGGKETLPGKILGLLGAKGINRGVSEDAANQVASPIVGSINAARGLANTPEHPIAGPLQAVGGALQAASLPMAFMGGPAANKAINAIPSRAYAGKVLGEVKEAAGAIPVNPNAAGEIALRIDTLAKSGGSMPKVVRDFLRRVTAPDAAPMTFAEARDFYSNATKLSANETNRLTPVMQRQVAMFTKALGKSLAEAADVVGQGGNYTGAMREYAQAMKLKGYSDAAINFFVKRLLPAGIIGAAGYEGYKIVNK